MQDTPKSLQKNGCPPKKDAFFCHSDFWNRFFTKIPRTAEAATPRSSAWGWLISPNAHHGGLLTLQGNDHISNPWEKENQRLKHDFWWDMGSSLEGSNFAWEQPRDTFSIKFPTVWPWHVAPNPVFLKSTRAVSCSFHSSFGGTCFFVSVCNSWVTLFGTIFGWTSSLSWTSMLSCMPHTQQCLDWNLKIWESWRLISRIYTGWWLNQPMNQPIWKILVKLDHLPR